MHEIYHHHHISSHHISCFCAHFHLFTYLLSYHLKMTTRPYYMYSNEHTQQTLRLCSRYIPHCITQHSLKSKRKVFITFIYIYSCAITYPKVVKNLGDSTFSANTFSFEVISRNTNTILWRHKSNLKGYFKIKFNAL